MKKALLILFLGFLGKVSSSENVAQFVDNNAAETDLNATTTPTAFVFDTIDIDSPNISLNGTQVTFSKAGIYEVSYSLSFRTTDNNGGDARRHIKSFIKKNGMTNIAAAYGYARIGNDAENANNTASFAVPLQVGDYVELFYHREGDRLGLAPTNVGESWMTVKLLEEDSSAGSVTSCLGVLTNNPSAQDGVYVVDIGGQTKAVYCDMTTDGGGWTLVARGEEGNTSGWRTSAEVNVPSNPSPSSTSFKMSDQFINSIKTMAYRTSNDGYPNDSRFFPASCVYDHVVQVQGECLKSYGDPFLSSAFVLGESHWQHAGLSDYRTAPIVGNIVTSIIQPNVTHGWAVGKASVGMKTGDATWSYGSYPGVASYTLWVK